jgi:glycosyltransferase involved in cell wall biosynthesis
MRAAAIPVGFFLTSFESGGTERQMLELISRLDSTRFEIHLACFHRRGVWLSRAERAAASVTEFPIDGFLRPSTTAAMWCFARWCRAHRLAILHTCDFYANVFGLAGGALARVPVRIANRRELNPDKSRGQITVQRLAYGLAHRIVANSAAAADALVAEKIPHDRIRVIPNGVDVHAYRARHHGRRSKITIVAKLRREKAHEVLVEAAALLAPRFRELCFELVGDGPRESEIRALVHARGLDSRFSFLGHRDDIPAILEATDLFVLPSRSEAFPNSVLEAMAAALPIVTTRVGGLRELVDHGRTGLLVPPDDPRALADAIASLVECPDRSAALGRAARRHVESRYSFDRMVARFEHVYLTELSARGMTVSAARRDLDTSSPLSSAPVANASEPHADAPLAASDAVSVKPRAEAPITA